MLGPGGRMKHQWRNHKHSTVKVIHLSPYLYRVWRCVMAALDENTICNVPHYISGGN